MHGIGYTEANQMLVCQLRGEQQQEAIATPGQKMRDQQIPAGRFNGAMEEKRHEAQSGLFAIPEWKAEEQGRTLKANSSRNSMASWWTPPAALGS